MVTYPQFIRQRGLRRLAEVLHPALRERLKFNLNHSPLTKAGDPPHVTAALKKAKAFALQLTAELRGFAEDIAVGRLERALATNSLFLIEQAINFAQMDRVLERVTKPELDEGFIDGAKVGVKDLAKVDASIDFKLMDPRAVEWAQQSSAKLVTNVTQSQKELVADLVTRAQAEGRTVQQTARDLREFIGLLPQHAEAVEHYKAGLLADGVAEAKADRLGEKYARELLAYRTETIARHELLTATHEGQLQSIREAVSQGQLDPSVTQRVWTAADDERLCDICEPMDGVGVPADEPWTLEDGTPVWIPQEAHVQCRCSWSLVTNYDA